MKSEKTELRRKLRLARRAHVAALEDTTRALLFRRPPAPLIPLLRFRAEHYPPDVCPMCKEGLPLQNLR